ncbi:MAG TPA: ATP-binding cassette domain-containing protein, partial [Blastocatellia bacterium]|nr:ATP-binding cassette domain-containing protein [Blastocatellia bacterium]
MLQLNNLTKDYTTPRGSLPILTGVNLSFNRGDAVAMMGPSGSGKSTLLYLLGALEPPTNGTVTLDG